MCIYSLKYDPVGENHLKVEDEKFSLRERVTVCISPDRFLKISLTWLYFSGAVPYSSYDGT